MEENATISIASTPTKVAVAKQRRLRCLDWLQKQNSEEPKKQWLQNKNLNDIQFIVETNAERSNFLKKAADDDATVPAGVDDTQVEPKEVPLHLLRIESLLLECGWQECYWNTNDYEQFQKHVREHVRDLNISETDGESMYACLWDTCGHKTPDCKEIVRHLHYHAYHAKLLAVGYNGRPTLKLEQCQKDSSKRNQLPILPDEFICRWIDCGFTFSCIQTFFTHVSHHLLPPAKLRCFWAGCGYQHRRREVLKQHMRTHTGERLIACYHCGRRFCSNRKLLDHLRRQNTESSNFLCAVCGAAQGSAYLLRAHTRAHVSMHACALCDMSAPTLTALAQHVRYRHMSGHRAHQCPRCEYRAITKWDLRKHIPTHFKKKKSKPKSKDTTHELEETSEKDELSDKEGLSNEENEEVKQKPKKSKKYICHMCPEKSQKIFTRGSLLTTHLVKMHGAQWSYGHSRFRYTISDDGLYRLTTTRYESLEVSEKMMMGNCTGPRTIPNSMQFQLVKKCDATEKSPQQFEITIKDEQETNADMPPTVEIEMCDVDEFGNIISKEVVKSDVYFTS